MTEATPRVGQVWEWPDLGISAMVVGIAPEYVVFGCGIPYFSGELSPSSRGNYLYRDATFQWPPPGGLLREESMSDKMNNVADGFDVRFAEREPCARPAPYVTTKEAHELTADDRARARAESMGRILDCYLADGARELCASDDALWERFLAILHPIVRHRVGRPWISDAQLFRWASASDILQAAREAVRK